MSTGSRKNLTVYAGKFCKGKDKKMARSSENRGTDKNRLHVVFSRPEPIEPETAETSPHALETVPQTTIDESFLLFLYLFERRDHEPREQ